MQIDREKEAMMVANEDSWPGETLCVKQLPKPGERTGVMGYAAFGVIASSRLPLIVYLRPNFVRERRYASIDALLDDGWIVD